jgi:hypothetical protein
MADKDEKGTKPAKQPSREEILEKLANQTPEERAVEYLEEHPNLKFEHVLVTSDKAVFLPTLVGRNAAQNHAKSLKNQKIFQVTRKGDVTELVDDNGK